MFDQVRISQPQTNAGDVLTVKPAAKRPRPSVGSALKKPTAPAPDYDKGVEYWNNIEASVDGVLGGFGEGVGPLSALPPAHMPM